MQDQGNLDEAMEAYQKALAIKPDYADTHNNMGNTLQDQGKQREAVEAFQKAISLKPDFPEAHRNLSSINKYTPSNHHFLQDKKLYKDNDLDEGAICNLNFALSKMYEDMGTFDKAFKHLDEGNTLRKKILNYSIDIDEKLFSLLKKTQSSLAANSIKTKSKDTKQKPIFILGMPRSGTTLVEQIISSHSKVFGAGELKYVEKLGSALATEPRSITTEAVSEFRERYLSELSKVSNGNNIVTDKMPQNFRFIPLICAALPEAKIIHVKRDPKATCWSNYKQYFVTKNLGYCYNLQDLVSYYGLYSDLMDLWKSEYGDKIYNLTYEKLTTDQEQETRNLLKYWN